MKVVTTAISGSGEKTYLERFSGYAAKKKKKVLVYNVGEMMMEHAARRGIRMPPDKVLNTNPHTLDERRSAVFERIVADIARLENKGFSFVLNMHGEFYWNYRYEPALDFYYLNEFGPDLYVNFLNDVGTVERNLRHRKQWQFLFDSGKPYPNYGRDKILDWQSVEVMLTRVLAQRDPKRWEESIQPKFFVVPVKATEKVLYRLMFEPWRKKFYMGMPLTLFTDPKYRTARKRIDKLVAELETYINVSDPRYVEPLSKKHLQSIDLAMYHNVVARDLYWLMPSADGMIAFFPKVAYSAGVNTEIKEMRETCGETILIYPPNRPASPFLIAWSGEVFRSEEEFKKAFLGYLGKRYVRRALASAD